MKIKLLIIALFTVLFCATLQAQPAKEPDKSFHSE